MQIFADFDPISRRLGILIPIKAGQKRIL